MLPNRSCILLAVLSGGPFALVSVGANSLLWSTQS